MSIMAAPSPEACYNLIVCTANENFLSLKNTTQSQHNEKLRKILGVRNLSRIRLLEHILWLSKTFIN